MVTEEEYIREAFEKAKENHIWISKAHYLISPTDEQKIALADMILEKLRCRETQMPSPGIISDEKVIRDLAELTPVLWLKVNWS